VHFSATLRHHLVCFQLTSELNTECCDARQTRWECRIADRTLHHAPPAGSLAICPAGIDAIANADGGSDVILIIVAVDPSQLMLAAAEDSARERKLVLRLSGYDQPLLQLARTLALESGNDYPGGPLFWNEAAHEFVDGLLARHTSLSESRERGRLSKDVLMQLKDYVVAHLDGPIKIATLAKLAGRSRYNFTRVFTGSVGVSPSRYVMSLRLQRAIELVRDGRSGLAEIAARTGFADQSHLSRWVRRVYGASPGKIGK
jgi:AraC family transcriptional regulator